MVTSSQHHTSKQLRVGWIRKRDDLIERLTPRPCMVVSVGFIFAGISIPFMMAADILPVSFLLGFIGFALTATGGVLALVFCGEI